MKKIKKGIMARQIDSMDKLRIVDTSVRFHIWLRAFERKMNSNEIMTATDPEFID